MARGGINKALVEKARTAVLQQGKHPSIDAVRVELGNTGSKSTIHRYLKELEDHESARMDDEALLGEPIKELVARLASGLREQAQATIEEHRADCEKRVQTLTEQLEEQKESTIKLDKLLADQSVTLEKTQRALSLCEASETALTARELEARQDVSKLAALIDEKQHYIDSLEEKHRHNRDAMAHYRQSVKDLRDQDQRKHEQQLQHFQAELRAANQNVSIKQTDITQLNKDNARLVSELSAAQKLLSGLESAKHSRDILIKDLESQVHVRTTEVENYQKNAAAWQEEKENLIEQLLTLRSEQEEAIITIAKLEAETHVKTVIIERMMLERKNLVPINSSENKQEEG